MKLLWNEKVYGWWSVTGLIGTKANWFFGFSRKPPSPAQPLPPTTDPRTDGVGAVDLLQQHASPEKFVSKADIDRAHGVMAASPGWLDDALRLLNDIRKDVRQSKFGGLQCDELERVLRDSSGVEGGYSKTFCTNTPTDERAKD